MGRWERRERRAHLQRREDRKRPERGEDEAELELLGFGMMHGQVAGPARAGDARLVGLPEIQGTADPCGAGAVVARDCQEAGRCEHTPTFHTTRWWPAGWPCRSPPRSSPRPAPGGYRALADQMLHALMSTVLSIAEGANRGGAGSIAEGANRGGAGSLRARAVASPRHRSHALRMIDGGEFASSGPELRSIQHRVTVSAERAAVFAAFTTTEGLKAFLQVEARVELRVGGAYELYFAEAGEAPRGQRGSEGCKILGYLPGQMLCFSWNAPPHLPEEREQHTWVVLRLRDAGPGRTRVSLTHTGFGRGGRWDEVIAYFEMAWAKVLAALGAHFGTAPPGVRMQSLILAVTNLERSVRFYEAAFAWPRRIDVPVLVELALPDGGGLALYERGGFAVNTRQAPETVPAGAIAGTEIYLRCEDLDAAIAGLEAAGARPLSARAPRDWGDEAAYYADPDGNVVAVSRPLR